MPSKPSMFKPVWKAKTVETRTDEAKSRQAMYDRRWRKQRAYYIQLNPLCVMCLTYGVTREATVVDHIEPHKGDERLFWDIGNWQSLCKRHHDSDKQRIERRGGAGKN